MYISFNAVTVDLYDVTLAIFLECPCRLYNVLDKALLFVAQLLFKYVTQFCVITQLPLTMWFSV